MPPDTIIALLSRMSRVWPLSRSPSPRGLTAVGFLRTPPPSAVLCTLLFTVAGLVVREMSKKEDSLAADPGTVPEPGGAAELLPKSGEVLLKVCGGCP